MSTRYVLIVSHTGREDSLLAGTEVCAQLSAAGIKPVMTLTERDAYVEFSRSQVAPHEAISNIAVLDGEVEYVALVADALSVENVEFDLLERWRHLVLDDLDAGAVTHWLGAVLQGFNTAHLQANR